MKGEVKHKDLPPAKKGLVDFAGRLEHRRMA